MPPAIPVGVCIRPMGATWSWFRDSALRLEDAGYAAIWTWDHFVGRGRPDTPVLEAWTTLTATAAVTSRVRVGTFVANVMNRHPAVLARAAATLQEVSDGRLVLGIGIGGAPAEHAAYGMPLPEAPERVARLEEAVTVLRALWTGGPVTFHGRFYSLEDAVAYPIPVPAPPIVVGGETRAGAILAARIGDGWTSFTERFALETAGRDRASVHLVVGYQRGVGEALADSPWLRDPLGEPERWRDVGADEVVLTAKGPEDVDALVRAAAAW